MNLKLALFGDPVEHSFSPRIHRAFGRQSGIGVDFQLIECPRGELARHFHAFAASGGTGCNLTVPVKPEGVELADTLTAAARFAGAVNTLTRTESGWLGDNTDGAGLLADFDRLGIEVTGRRVLLLGAGGAAAGILGPLLERAPETVWIANRDRQRAAALAGRVDNGRLHATGLEALDADAEFELVIHATSAGRAGHTPVMAGVRTAPGTVVYDLNYGPAHRPLAEWAGRRGLAIHDGLGMLVEQAALSFLQFSGRSPATAAVLEDLRAGSNGSV